MHKLQKNPENKGVWMKNPDQESWKIKIFYS